VSPELPDPEWHEFAPIAHLGKQAHANLAIDFCFLLYQRDVADDEQCDTNRCVQRT
jgi:hypothetical protein